MSDGKTENMANEHGLGDKSQKILASDEVNTQVEDGFKHFHMGLKKLAVKVVNNNLTGALPVLQASQSKGAAATVFAGQRL